MIYTLTLNPAVDRELTVPEMEFDSVLRASESRVDFGGKGFNVFAVVFSMRGVGRAALLERRHPRSRVGDRDRFRGGRLRRHNFEVLDPHRRLGQCDAWA